MANNEREIEKLRDALAEARTVIEQQAEDLERLGAPPYSFGSILRIDEETVTVATSSNSYTEVARPKKIDLQVGDTVFCGPESGAIIAKARAILIGNTAVIGRVLSAEEAEIGSDGGAKVVLRGAGVDELRDGDKVVLDHTGNVIVRAMRREREKYDFAQDTGVTWESIGGQVEAKREMIEAVELPIKQAAIFRHYGKRPTKGILLYGPPGCGKTMLGKAAASAIASASHGSAAAAFMYVKGPELLDMYVGQTEASIRTLFQRARMHKAETGVPAVIFIDEADAILGRRGDRQAHMEKTIVPAFLTEMDGMEDSGALVILATNRPDTLDSAVTRDGRIDRKVRVSRPGRNDARDIFELYLKRVPMAKGANLADCATAACDELFSDSRTFYRLTMANGHELTFTLANLVSGALIAGVVDQACSIAMHRDLAAGGKPSGVGLSDLTAAIDRVYQQNRDVDHRDALHEFADGREIVNMSRLSYAEAA